MTRSTQKLLLACILIAAAVGIACGDLTPNPVAPFEVTPDSLRVSASARWNQRAVALVVARQPTSNGQAAVSRILTYLSIAQLRAVAAAQSRAGGAAPPSIPAAVGGASVAVLNAFFPLDVATTEAALTADRALPALPSQAKDDLAAGETLGRAVGAAAMTQAASDNYLTASPGAPPVGADKWVSSSAAVVRSVYGTRPFFLSSPGQVRAPAPPAVGSAAFLTALAEVRQIADTRTAAQTATAISWNTNSGTFTAGALNLIADSLIRQNHPTELEAARILAVANAAAFDAQIACWDSKFTYWYPRPTQADSKITMAIALPNHPSYPSGHSCMTGAFFGVVAAALPKEKAKLDALVEEAGMSRVYGGIHFRFDCDAGRDMGRAVAAIALTGSLN